MKFYMVFGSRFDLPPGRVHFGRPEDRPRALTWDSAPIGVFQAQSPEKACAAAARKEGTAGTYFAIEGHPWGIEVEPLEDVAELGYDELFGGHELEAGDEDVDELDDDDQAQDPDGELQAEQVSGELNLGPTAG